MTQESIAITLVEALGFATNGGIIMPLKNWALNNGYEGDLTIDRIDNNGDYEPNNCRWVDYKTQARNRRGNRVIEYKGQSKTLSEWADEIGMSANGLASRIDAHGWGIEKAIETPLRKSLLSRSEKPDPSLPKVKGVSWESRTRQWIARVRVKGKTLFAKRFNQFGDAVAAVIQAQREIHGESFINDEGLKYIESMEKYNVTPDKVESGVFKKK